MINAEYNVLIFPCGTEIANEILASIQHHKYFKPVLANSEEISFCSFRNDHVFFLPHVDKKNFIEKLNRLILEQRIDFIIPAHDDVALELSLKEKEILAKIIGQPAEVNKIVRFKDKTYDFFKKIIPVPKVLNILSENFSYPIFVKPKRGQGSNNSFKIVSDIQLEYFKQNYFTDDFVFMEYLPGKEFTVDCFSDNGKVLFVGGRERQKTIKGISSMSSLVGDPILNKQFEEYAQKISEKLHLHGLWFFQLKEDAKNNLKLLEIGPRVSGTMMLNRMRGINFVELSLYQKLGKPVEVIINHLNNLSVARYLAPIFKSNIEYKNLYVDFDDTLVFENKKINSKLMMLIFQAINEGKHVYLISKHKDNQLEALLRRFGIQDVFQDIILLNDRQKKSDFIKNNSILIDDSFAERKQAIINGIPSFDITEIDILLKNFL